MDYYNVTYKEAGMRLDRWCKNHFPTLAAVLVQKHVRKGFIRVDDKKATIDQALQEGQVVRIHPVVLDESGRKGAAPKPKGARAISAEDARHMQDLVIYKDASVIVINKPAGLAVQGGTKIEISVDGLLDALRFGEDQRPRLVHRLDKDTSGVLLLARSGAVAADLTEQFRRKDMEKIYWALTVGHPPAEEGKITLPLAVISGKQGEKVVIDEEQGQSARTLYRVVEKVGKQLCWLELSPQTGRKHQLRVHLASGLNIPIVGDGKYGGADAFVEGIAEQMHLHARSLSFTLNGKDYDFTAPLPEHMKRTWKMLELSN